MIMGCNLISGYAHARDLIYANTLFKAYNTDQKILETFHLAEMAGITASFLTNSNFPIFQKYLKLYGGKMKTICQTYLKDDDLFGDIDLAIDNGATTLYIHQGWQIKRAWDSNRIYQKERLYGWHRRSCPYGSPNLRKRGHSGRLLCEDVSP
jgi:hypothetical protein